ncbi:hypothetical protein IWQ60_003287 [Tieghemiomyces parasiticus]|uniref:molybdopterin adenylyltransferase n=1 Tax=Tieghemiomyces parasiticus TaxID=78921 RepID=A0A9W8ADJ3_9FUNG|nr:hypothetical protein IWQ60_003287 [Tieghemiomyces parasiticus]
MTAEYRVAILVVSTSVYQGTTADRAVEHLVGFLRTAGRATWRVIATDVVADDVGQIQRAVTRWTQPAAPRDLHNPDNYFQASADPTIDLLLTSGGTGLSPDDVTPEAVEPLLTRICPGFTAAMLTHSLGITPLATLSRPVCGVRCRTLVLTLPGKPKAAVENLEAVLPSLPHALDLIRGQASSRELHQRMNPAGGAEQHSGAKPQLPPRPTGHGHGHGHRCVHADHPTVVDPSATSHVHHRVAVAHRHRESQFPMVSVAEAGRLILNQLSTDLGTETLAVTPALAGRVLAQDVVAPVSVPAFRASMVDGYAVRAADGPGIYQVGPASVAGSLAQDVPALTDSAVQGGAQGATAASSTLTAVRVSTGAPVPDGADAVVMVEYTELNAMAADDQEEASIIISGTVQSGENIRAVGSDIQQGQVVLHTGDRLGLAGAELGALVSLGVRQVEVYRRPIVGVFSTGSELVDGPGSAEGATAGGETPLPAGRIYDSNRPALLAALRGHNFPVVDLGIVRDE